MQPSGQEKTKKATQTDDTLSRLASIGQIAAGIAHEVRNPLTAVKGFLQLLQREVSHSYLDFACSELEQAISTLQDLLQVSKPDLEDESCIAINLCSELESLLYLFQDQIYRVQIAKKFRNSDEIIYGKRNQLKKAFFNLLKNAFEAIPNEGTITIEHYRVGDIIYVIISDTGVGVPKEKLQLLGTPFFTTKDEGTGMGLTQVYSTIYQHGGTIDVKSREGIGTTFTIQFQTK
ncbi:ATPase/histidine kinase/DNA gyrase B/HSP90 domain protein [Paenibacillus sp. oral taxon 786 str. D14]|uniref:ATP-binding protein n=1 Tax=Paenibacillus sp. oral taxon 786 TaxID=652715 RepID=UPI0001AFD9D0|nr:ATP-binding protein [Paenibacillus sp. oral taxon 786]EES73123.1 ATPase/histidine kinase/DNA gyrase B/HSP90 domain protein [Paenibacillus sp. oral taxon 786 str. D14]